LDVDLQGLMQNPARLKVVADAAALPFKDSAFRTVCSEHLLEHLSNPADVFRESRRVLRDSGHFIFAAPNGWSYIALLARTVPLRFRAALVLFAAHGMDEHKHFPTYYRANSVFSVRRLARRSGLTVERLEGFVGEPCYTLSLPVVHLIAIVWHKMLEVFCLQRVIGITLVGSLGKKR
jgi:SAM-dependent methyltransferase